MIEVKNIFKSFGDKNVLEDVSFKIEDGKIFGLVGINGAGKSTLLRIMSGVYKADNGEVLYDYQNVYDNPNVKKDIFFLSDSPYYPKNWTIDKFLAFYSTYYEVDMATFNKLLREFNLPLNKTINNFSKGMKRQLFIALTIAIAPKYLLLDEAFDGLDPLARLIFKRALFEALDKKRMTVIISSHSLRELEDLCDLYGILDNRKIMYSGDLGEDKTNINTYQIVFDKEKSKEDFKHLDVIHFSRSGRVLKMVIKGNKNDVINELNKMKPLLLETIPLNFEDLFIYQVNKKGYIEDEK